MVRAGEHGRLFEDFKQHSIVAIDWDELGELTNFRDADEVRRKVEDTYKNAKPGSKAMAASQVCRFRFDFKENDCVITYSPKSRKYLVGTIKGPYYYDVNRKEYRNVRITEWKGTVSRDDLSPPTRNTLGAISTIFDAGEDAEKEVIGLLKDILAGIACLDWDVETTADT